MLYACVFMHRTRSVSGMARSEAVVAKVGEQDSISRSRTRARGSCDHRSLGHDESVRQALRGSTDRHAATDGNSFVQEVPNISGMSEKIPY